ncbi:MAG: HD domain-containing response regulator [Eubacteriales bacterium]|nr:HD domain-containing response regulator [Eubacteriales bacterium]
MRRSEKGIAKDIRIFVLDDEQGIIDTLKVVLNRNGYDCVGCTDPVKAIGNVLNGNYDLLILDYLMHPLHGDEVVEEIRKFNKEIYILLLTGHKDLAPPLDTIRELDIQGYCEKSDKFDQLLLLVESGIKSIKQVRTIKRFEEGLNRILKSVPKIYQLQPIMLILEEILYQLLNLVECYDAFIMVDDIEDDKNMAGVQSNQSIYRGMGRYKTDIKEFMNALPADLIESIGMAKISKKTVQYKNGAVFPLVNEYGKCMGVLYVESIGLEEGERILAIFANQAAASINNAFLHSLLNIKNEELERTYDQLRERYMDTIEVLRMVVDAKDSNTRGHSDRVAYYSVKIGTELGLSPEEIELLRVGGLFHDVGKIGTANDILFKREALNNEEYAEIKKHPIKGASILSAISMFKDVVPIVKYHHERMDGTGYPDGISNEDIPFPARIVAVADAFDAMMSDRSYRERLGLDAATRELIKYSGTQFDPGIIEVFIKILGEQDKLIDEAAATSEKLTQYQVEKR